LRQEHIGSCRSVLPKPFSDVTVGRIDRSLAQGLDVLCEANEAVSAVTKMSLPHPRSEVRTEMINDVVFRNFEERGMTDHRRSEIDVEASRETVRPHACHGRPLST